MNKIALVIFALFLALAGECSGQQFGADYAARVGRADSLFQAKQYRESGALFNRAFAGNGGVGYLHHRYTAVSAWAMVNEADSAFYHLFRIIERVQYDELDKVLADSTLHNLRADPRWEKAIGLIKANKDLKEAKYDRRLIAVLDSVFASDQKYRLTVYDTINKYGMDSPEVRDMNTRIIKADSINIGIVTNILDTHGWPGPEVIATHGNTLFLVLQHSDIPTQLKYLPVMRDAVKRGAAQNSSLALLEDRVALGQGRCQIYGSQIGLDEKTNHYYVLPTSDPIQVDQRRKEAGLEPLKDYAAHWKIVWKPETHRQDLKELLGEQALEKYDCFQNENRKKSRLR